MRICQINCPDTCEYRRPEGCAQIPGDEHPIIWLRNVSGKLGMEIDKEYRINFMNIYHCPRWAK